MIRTITVEENIKLGKYTPIAVAEDREIALECVEMLKSQKITARTNANSTEVAPYGVTVLVRNDQYDRAFTLIRERTGPNGFFDASMMNINEMDSPNPINATTNPTQAA